MAAFIVTTLILPRSLLVTHQPLLLAIAFTKKRKGSGVFNMFVDL